LSASSRAISITFVREASDGFRSAIKLAQIA